MTFDEYQEAAHQTSKNTSIGGDTLLYPVLGLGDEIGEVLGKLKKCYRDNNGVLSDIDKYKISLELGDCTWYLAEICTQLGISFETVARRNLEKLADRAERGVIGGSGDER